MKTCYLLYTDRNILSLPSLTYLAPEKVVLVMDPDFQGYYQPQDFIDFLKDKGFSVTAKEVTLSEEGSLAAFVGALGPEDGFIFSPLPYAPFFNLHTALAQGPCQLYLIEADGDLYRHQNGYYQVISLGDQAISLEDYFHNMGGHVTDSTKALFDQDLARQVLDYILDHQESYGRLLRTYHPLKTDPFDQQKTYLEFSGQRIPPQEYEVLSTLINMLYQGGACSIRRKANKKIIYFHQPAYKDYLTVAGKWLEHLAYEGLRRCQLPADASVSFYWRSDKTVRNELDAMAIYNKTLLLFSCKDTKDLKEDALYELHSHWASLGPSFVRAFLITTAYPGKYAKERADQLGIRLLQYQGDPEAFYHRLKKEIES